MPFSVSMARQEATAGIKKYYLLAQLYLGGSSSSNVGPTCSLTAVYFPALMGTISKASDDLPVLGGTTTPAGTTQRNRQRDRRLPILLRLLAGLRTLRSGGSACQRNTAVPLSHTGQPRSARHFRTGVPAEKDVSCSHSVQRFPPTSRGKETPVCKMRITGIALAFLAVTTVFAQVKIRFVEYNLANGLHVILHEDKSTPIVSQVVAYHVGSKNEKPDRTGFAHFFEHLMFEGSPNIQRGTFFKLVQSAGGELNAFTSFDKTVYFITLPSNQLELAMWLESERMLQLRVDSVGIETQRGVVKEERKQGLENRPYGTLLEQTMAHAFKVHPYRWTPIGSAQYIDRATEEEFRQFYKSFYVPNNACLVIAGDIDVEKTRELVQKYYGDIPRGTGTIFRPTDVEPPQTAEVRDTVYDNIQLPAVIEAYHMAPQGSKDYYALSMLTTLLSGGQSSRLTKRVVDKDKLAVVAQTIPLDLEDPAVFLVFSIANFGKSPRELEGVMQEEIAKTQAGLLTGEEFAKIRNQKETAFIEKTRTVQGKAMELANYHIFFGDANLINAEITRFMEVTREDIQRVAKQYLTPNNRTVLYYLPKAKVGG